MGMPDGAYMIGLGISLFGAGFAIHSAFDGWIKLKRFEHQTRETQPPAPPAPVPDLDAAARMARIEQIVELTALEVERVAEAQRFVARQLADAASAPQPLRRPPERVITPH